MFHLRYTPYDISGYTFDFLEKYERYIVAQEDTDDDGTPLLHYHILVDTEYDIQTLRLDAKVSLKIPKAGRGKNNKYYALIDDWKDPGYICKYNQVLRAKCYTDKEILEFVISGKKRYLDKVEKTEVAPAVPRKPKEAKVPFQQAVIAYAAAEWYKYKAACKESGDFVSELEVIEFVIKGMRENGKGINQYLVKELAYAVLYDDLDFRDIVLKKIKSFFLL